MFSSLHNHPCAQTHTHPPTSHIPLHTHRNCPLHTHTHTHTPPHTPTHTITKTWITNIPTTNFTLFEEIKLSYRICLIIRSISLVSSFSNADFLAKDLHRIKSCFNIQNLGLICYTQHITLTLTTTRIPCPNP